MNGTSLPLRDRLAARLHELQCDRAHCDEQCKDDYEYEAADEIIAMFATEQPNSAPSDLRERILDEIEDPDDCAHGHPSCAKCLYERREGLLREAADALDRTPQAQRLTDAAYSRLLLLIGNASYTSTVPTKAELEAAINGGAQ